MNITFYMYPMLPRPTCSIKKIYLQYLVRVQACSWSVCQWWNFEGVGHQVLLSIHQVLQLLLVQETLEELAVVGARELHAVVTLRKVASISVFVVV